MTYRSNVGEACDCAMRVHVGGRQHEVDEPSQNQERRIGVLAGMLLSERRPRDRGGDACELPNVSAPNLLQNRRANHARTVRCRKKLRRKRLGTHVSFTPHRLGHSIASSVMRSESRSMPPHAPGSAANDPHQCPSQTRGRIGAYCSGRQKASERRQWK